MNYNIIDNDIQITRSFENLVKDYRFPMIIVSFSPREYPRTWVARLYDTEKNTGYYALANSYKELESFRPLEMVIYKRDSRDVTSVKEIWI
jgi:hypothetical protein